MLTFVLNIFFIILLLVLAARYYASARPIPSCGVCLYVCPSVCLSHSIESKKHIFKNVSSSDSHTILVFFYTKPHGNILTGTVSGGVKCRWCRYTSRFSKNSWLSIDRLTAAVQTTTSTVHRAIYRTERRASVNLRLSQPAWTTTTKRKEQNRIYLYAAVNLKRKQLIENCINEFIQQSASQFESHFLVTGKPTFVLFGFSFSGVATDACPPGKIF